MISEDRFSIATSNAERYLLRAGEKHPYRHMENAVIDARRKLDRMKGTGNALSVIADEEKQLQLLENENATVRNELKSLNEHLTRMLEHVKDQNIAKGRKKSERPTSQRLRARDEEIKNSDKQMRNLVHEHQKLTRRLE